MRIALLPLLSVLALLAVLFLGLNELYSDGVSICQEMTTFDVCGETQ